jgi:signal transduction histidine kinase/CheY-like chemotaxis protein/HPt (histidine-containing phosphotransfer) domain-containing protein
LSVFLYQDMSNRLKLFKDGELLKLEYMANVVSIEMGSLFGNLSDLMHRRSIVRYLDEPNTKNLNEVKTSFLLFSKDNPQYDQLRLLAKDGQEILRINALNGNSWLVPDAELQNKADRYYFKDAVPLRPGEIYTSPLDLNVERGQLELPHKPMLRLAVPLRDSQGTVQAVLVLNYLGDVLLRKLHNRLEFQRQTVMLLNQDGYWLHGGGEDDWAFMFPERKGRTFAAAFPALWQAMNAAPSGQFQARQGLYTYATIVLTPDALPGLDSLRSHVPAAFRQTWKVVTFTPAAVLAQVRWQLWPLYATGAGLVLVLNVLGAYLHASRMLERKRAEEALGASEARFRGLVETSPNLIWETDTEGRFLYASPRAEALLGVPPGQLLGTMRCGFGLDDDGLDAASDDPAEAADDATDDATAAAADDDGRWPRNCERICRTPDGIERVLEISSVPMRDGRGRIIGRRGVAHDITEQKQTQRQLDAARREAELANQAKSEFLARMSHEIRTPLNAVVGMTHLALKTELSPKQYDYLTKIRRSADTLLAVINDILDYSKIEAGKLSIESVPFDLDAVVGSVVDINSLNAEEKSLEFLLSVGDDVPSGLVGDPLRLGQVLLNLVGNAVKFTDSGEVLLSVHRESIHETGVRLRFAVRDTGIGLTEEQRVNLFKPFSQADGTITRRFGGTGLGLSICQRLVERMGGRLEVESALGRGSTFTFALDFPLSETPRKSCLEDACALEGLSALVVDDNATSRQILGEILESLRFTHFEAASGEEGLRLLERAENDIRVVLLDWKMPGMNGVECARRIRSMGLARPPAVIIVTAYGREEVRREAELVGVEGFLLKPVSRSVLYNTIAVAVGHTPALDKCLPDVPAAAEDGPHGRLKGRRVLVVEDNEINQQVARELLEGVGVAVSLAGDGEQALAALAAESFDAVLMDVQMPVLDGLETTRRLRAEGRFDALPIIAMTAHAMDRDRRESLAAGMNDHVNKPIDPRELYAALTRWIVDRPGQARAAVAASAAPSVPPSSAAAAPILDTDLGLSRVRGNAVLYHKLLGDFAEKYGEVPRSIRERLAVEDLSAAKRLAHTLKGVAGNVGAMRLYTTAMEVEACVGVLPRRCEAALKRLDRTLRETRAAIEAFRGEAGQVDGGGDKTPLRSPEELLVLAEKLMELVSQNDTSALDVLEELSASAGRFVPDLLGAASEALAKLDFRGAQAPVSALRDRLAAVGRDGAD